MPDIDPNTIEISKGYGEAKCITRHWAKTFYLASRFLPSVTQRHAYAVYAVCRISDDSVDSGDASSQEMKLAAIQREIADAYGTAALEKPLLMAFRDTIRACNIPKRYFDELITGMRMDLHIARYANFDELYQYCWRVAGVVGLIMLRVFGVDDPLAEPSAEKLGVAMQLTNILRDIEEDFSRARIYLPQDEMARFSVTETGIATATADDNFKDLMRFQIRRARQYYQEAQTGIPRITSRRCRFVASAMKNLYAGILSEIERSHGNVFGRRASVPTWRKCALLAATISGRSTI